MDVVGIDFDFDSIGGILAFTVGVWHVVCVTAMWILNMNRGCVISATLGFSHDTVGTWFCLCLIGHEGLRAKAPTRLFLPAAAFLGRLDQLVDINQKQTLGRKLQ